jgi:hypothetical protein
VVDAACGDPGHPERAGFPGGDGGFSKRHRLVLNELLGTDFGKTPSDSMFRLLLSQLDVEAFEAFLKGWIKAQPGVPEGLATLVCDVKMTLGYPAHSAQGDLGA